LAPGIQLVLRNQSLYTVLYVNVKKYREVVIIQFFMLRIQLCFLGYV